MSDAVNEWFSQENQSGSTGEPLLTKEQLAIKHNVCLSTFRKYTCKDVSMRTKLGISGGRKSIVSENNFKVITDFVIKLDQAPEQHNLLSPLLARSSSPPLLLCWPGPQHKHFSFCGSGPQHQILASQSNSYKSIYGNDWQACCSHYCSDIFTRSSFIRMSGYMQLLH